MKNLSAAQGLIRWPLPSAPATAPLSLKPGQKPMLRFDILEEIEKRLPGFPIVLHGASSVSQEYVKIIQANGGNLADAIGIPEDMLRQAAKKRCLQNQYRLRPAFGYDSRCAGSAVPETGSL